MQHKLCPIIHKSFIEIILSLFCSKVKKTNAEVLKDDNKYPSMSLFSTDWFEVFKNNKLILKGEKNGRLSLKTSLVIYSRNDMVLNCLTFYNQVANKNAHTS